MSDPAFRCSRASRAREDELIGSTTHVRPFLLVEHPGPWGQTALRDAALPGNLLAGLRRRSASTGVRMLLCRRHRQRGQDGVRVFAAYADPHRPWLETAVLDTHHELLDLDLEALGAGNSPGLTPRADPLFAVCTHGRHDACCAERGRPVAAALSRTHPEATWEVSHLGGDRFAANLLILGDGLGYGWLDPASVVTVAQTHLAGQIAPEQFRGRAGYPMPVQAAELAVRRHLGSWAIDALTLTGPPERSGDEQLVSFRIETGERYRVGVRRVLGAEPARLTCSTTTGDRVPRFVPGPVTGPG